MSLTPIVATLAVAGTTQARVMPMPPTAYGAIAFATFMVLLGILWTFRNTAARHDTPVRVEHGDTQGAHGAADPGAHH
jgi:hypothetical protein